MPRDAGVFLDDILDACRKIHRYTSDLTLEQFRSDENTKAQVEEVLRSGQP